MVLFLYESPYCLYLLFADVKGGGGGGCGAHSYYVMMKITSVILFTTHIK